MTLNLFCRVYIINTFVSMTVLMTYCDHFINFMSFTVEFVYLISFSSYLDSGGKYMIQNDDHSVTPTQHYDNILKDAKSKFKIKRLYFCRNSTNEDVLVGYDPKFPHNVIKEFQFDGIKVFIKHPHNITEQEAIPPAACMIQGNNLTAGDQNLIYKCIQQNSSRLWKDHSNLTVITGDSVKLEGGQQKSMVCIVLYCEWKGYRPRDENPFPTKLHFTEGILEVDVREGFFSFGPSTKYGGVDRFNDPLCMGSSIGKKGIFSKGSLGLFVDLPNDKQGFLTCCHVLFDCTGNEHFSFDPSSEPESLVVQPADGSLCGREDVDCGIIEKGEFHTDKPIAVDVALVQVTKRRATSGHFSVKELIQVKDAGKI